jgi:tetratricopeptide (TPR) repeat protein
VASPQRRSAAVAPAPIHLDRGEIERAAGGPGAPRFERRLREAARAFDMERFDDALPKLRSLAQEAPGAPSVRELYGLALYRVGRWADAARELEAFAQLTHSTEQHPVIADCYRALRRWDDVERLWVDLRDASPSAELVSEGRIVMAGALADQGQLPKAVALLAKGFKVPKRIQAHHLRRMYTLADLHERSGALAEARNLFRQVANVDPDFFDVVERVRHLG